MKKASNRMTNVVSALVARTQLGQIMKRATQKNERFIIDRRGEPSVIIMSVKDYVDTIAPTPDWLKDAHAHAKKNGLDKLTQSDINDIIGDVRRNQKKTLKTTSR